MTIPPNAFIGQAARPTEAELTEVLAGAKPLWDRMVADLAEEHGVGEEEWKSYSIKAGWSLRLKKKGRVIVYLIPCRGSVGASFALGDKAMEAAREAGFPPRIVEILDGAKRYAEGTGIRIDVKKKADVEIVKRLAAIKLAH